MNTPASKEILSPLSQMLLVRTPSLWICEIREGNNNIQKVCVDDLDLLDYDFETGKQANFPEPSGKTLFLISFTMEESVRSARELHFD